MDTSCQLADIAVPRPLRTALSYVVPAGMLLLPSMRVVVPLGRQMVVGLVLAVREDGSVGTAAAEEWKAVSAVLDAVPLLDAHWLAFLQWTASYYHHPIGEVVFGALPVALRKPKPLAARWHGLLAACVSQAGAAVAAVPLTPPQQDCLRQIQAWQQAQPPRPVLLHGITGSGKTEIYLHLLAPVVAAGQQVLVLVPEIALTPQLLARFQAFFPEVLIVCLHSGLAETARLQAWLQARSGQAAIVLGTRSAVFTPLPRLGMLVVDEEHDASFKQQDGCRYHARDLAVKRAAMLGIPIVLGSATPALETLHNAWSGRFHYVQLASRPGGAVMPQVQVQDSRPYELQAGLTPPSLQAMAATLQRGEQVMVFLNRRGFAPALYCPRCGWHASCSHCSVHMTWHARRNRLVCHHCGAEQATPTHCPACQYPHLTTQGQGTERLELLLQGHFPDFPVLRVDRDSTSRKGELEEKLASVRSNAPLILVGTQMLAKGHDFPNLTLVVVVDIDQALFSTDYRALERMGQLLVQVAGRAGRADKPGQVLVQTCQPEHPLLLQLLGQGYSAFAKKLLAERQRWQLPPFAHHCLVRASSAVSMEKALAFLTGVERWLAAHAPASLQRLGPVPALVEKRADRYRAQLLLSSTQRSVLHQALRQLLQPDVRLQQRSGIRWSVDIDPLDFT